MRYAVSASAGTLVWAALLACYLQVGVAIASDPEESSVGKGDDSNAQMEMSKREWNRNLHSWGKRAWQNLQGGWGKRDLWGPSSSYPLYVTEKRAWQNLQGGWGKRLAPSDEYAMRLAALLDEEGQGPAQYAEYSPDTEYDNDDEKRGWRSLNGAGWGKRSVLGQKNWAEKRNPAWGNLKGMWGKRSLEDRIAQ